MNWFKKEMAICMQCVHIDIMMSRADTVLSTHCKVHLTPSDLHPVTGEEQGLTQRECIEANRRHKCRKFIRAEPGNSESE